MAEIMIAVITGVCSIVGVVITSQASSRKLQHQLEIAQAVTDTKLETLTSEVRMHNGFASRIPVIEERLHTIENRIKALEREKNA